jgi:anaerobic magnesium-protoporphyrin IX monomethyl ester cyclase
MTGGKVILVNPRMCRPSSVRLPLSLLALAAVLKNQWDCEIVDGNLDPDPVRTILASMQNSDVRMLGLTVMPGPQVAPAIEISAAIRAAVPAMPIAWGGYFPTLYANAAINAPYVDYVIRGQGEDTLLALLDRLPETSAMREIAGLTWKNGSQIVHNPERNFRPAEHYPPYPYERVGDVSRYLRPSFMGSRTAVHQASLGCRYHCTFCGVVSMFNGYTSPEPARRLEFALKILRDRYGANAIQFYDHNFFDSESSSVPVLEVLEKMAMPWWCYARADTLAKFSARTWELLRKSRLTMAYIGAEAASDATLKRMRKGSRVEHTLEVARRCREYGVIPEFSFVLGGPEDPEGEIENTLQFIKRVKKLNPRCEIILYFYSPTPQRERRVRLSDPKPSASLPVLNSYGPNGPELPATPEEWCQPRWLNYVCHQDAPWLSERMRQRVKDFAKVLYCRFPTVQDYSTPAWGKNLLRSLASWRYKTGLYANARELDFARRLIPLRQPQRDSL